MIGINENWVVEFFRHDVKIKAVFLRYVSSFQNLFIFEFSTYYFAQNSFLRKPHKFIKTSLTFTW